MLRSRKRNLKRRLCEAQNHRCCYCGARMDEAGPKELRPTFEHVQARTNGGSDRADNLVIACLGCNLRRGHRNVKKFMRAAMP